MTIRKVFSVLFVLAMAALIAAPSVDAKSSAKIRRFSLVATDAGKAIDASGHARTRVRGSRQDLTVEVEARVANGTTYTVFVTNAGVTVTAGTIKINLGEGEIELKNYDRKKLPAGVAPVSGITSVIVKDANGTVILSRTL
jgi:hypothetical protein